MSQWNPSLFSSLGPLTMTVQSEQRELQWQQPHPIVWPSLQHGISVQRAEGGDYCVLTSKEVCLTWVWRCATRVSPWSSLAILISPPQTPFAATKLAAAHTEAGMAMHGQTYEHTQAPSSTHSLVWKHTHMHSYKQNLFCCKSVCLPFPASVESSTWFTEYLMWIKWLSQDWCSQTEATTLTFLATFRQSTTMWISYKNVKLALVAPKHKKLFGDFGILHIRSCPHWVY